ncbi:MAG: hypothetical protein K5668_10335 [Lachnospiraceae bacterium]|nr:hypothetical protein [Lachnospiraceae bacterium]
MGENLFSVLFSTIKSRFAAIVSKVKLWTSWNFIRTRIIGGIRDFFFGLLDVRPKHKNDYFTVFGWMVSKKLAYAAIIIIGVLSIWYIGATSTIFSSLTNTGGLRTYNYDSVLLRLASNRVRIKAKSGYVAYEGAVKDGYVTGDGVLYNPDGVTLYSGTFEKNCYEGNGTQYFDNGVMHYNGEFHENRYQGNGILYREDGTEEYEGGFFGGLKDGEGKLYDSGGNTIFAGSFASDNIVYSSLLGKTAEEVRSMYMGKQVLYEENENIGTDFAVLMNDINALYYASSDGGASDDSEKVQAVYILSDEFRTGEKSADEISELKSIFGEPVYEGNSAVIMPEAVAINILNNSRHTLNGRVKMDTTENYSDDIIINAIDDTYNVYIYTFNKGDLVYSFVCNQKGGHFEFYEIMDSGADDDAA